MKKTFIWLGIFLVLIPTSTWALNVQNFNPKANPGAGLHLSTPRTLDRGNLATGFYLNWVKNPLEVGTPTNRSLGIVDDFVTANILASYGIASWLTLNADVPFNLYHNIAPTFISTRDEGGGDAGDVRFSATLRLLSADKTEGRWGLALIPFVTAPSGDENIFFGDANATGGGIVAVEKDILRNRFYTNAGARFREKETYANLEVNDEFLFGLGWSRPLVEKWSLDIVAEANGSTTFDKFLNDDVTGPLDLHVAARKSWLEEKNLALTVGGTKGLTSGYSSPDARLFAGLSYTFGRKGKTKTPAKQEVTEVFFQFDKASVQTAYKPLLDQVAQEWKRRTEREIRIVGHTDNWGSEAYNDKLSQRRAGNVKKVLVQLGVDPGRITTVAKGELAPKAGNDTVAGRAENRRADMMVIVLK